MRIKQDNGNIISSVACNKTIKLQTIRLLIMVFFIVLHKFFVLYNLFMSYLLNSLYLWFVVKK